MRKFDREIDVVLSREQVRAVDGWAINKLGVPGVVLMENAGRSCAEYIITAYGAGVRVVIFCGLGNNGGDGYVVARHLVGAGCEVLVVICGHESKIKGDALINLEIIRKMGIDIRSLDVSSELVGRAVEEVAGGADVVVDGIFGTGLGGQLKPESVGLIEGINSLGKAIVAIDIPSGLDCDTGEPLGAAIRAAATITFVAGKPGFKNPETVKYTGEIYVASIGVEPASLKK